jgi:murein DD-endopeptidase MepM/ murein hydrolase activator NlpD
VREASVSPKQVFLRSAAKARIEFRAEAPGPIDLVVRVVGARREARRFGFAGVVPGTRLSVPWDGLRASGKPAPDGPYRILVGSPGGPQKRIGSLNLLGHAFPVRGSHGTRGGTGVFGAGRNGGRVHEGFDVVAPCGRALRAARAGTVVRRGFDPRLYGNFVAIRGLGERRSYFYAHLARPAEVARREQVLTGERLGRIGLTGNARGTPCHLHFEIHRRGRPIDPWPLLRRWDRFS